MQFDLPTNNQKPSILLVDDCQIMCGFYRIFLEKQYEVVTATNPLLAIEMVSEGFTPDVIVTDLNMPELSGTELIKQIKKILPATAIMVVSVDESKSAKQLAKAAGADDYMTKPFHPADLSNRLHLLLHPEARQTLWQALFSFKNAADKASA
jgi:DNA-binding response OmpR family regulator